MTDFVLVPGSCHGGWWYEPLVDALDAHGHRGLALTLTGLELEAANPVGVNLDTHVDDVCAVVRATAAESGPVVLVGHSYGGSVITAAADRLPEDVSALVYLDAFVPEDGDSCYAMTDAGQREWYIGGAGKTGLSVEPLAFFDARARPHPLGTLIQRCHLTGAWRSVAVKRYVAAMQWPGVSPFAPVTQRLEAEPGWTVQRWETRHNVLHDGPGRVLELLLDVAGELG
jgi:pimeloyl-ACP methyl ester carboxylesterase